MTRVPTTGRPPLAWPTSDVCIHHLLVSRSGGPATGVPEIGNCLIHTTPGEVAGYERLHDPLQQAALPALESLLF